MKDYRGWHDLKSRLNEKEHISFVNEREICYVSIGENIGFEQDGKHELFERPVLVLRKFGTQTFLGIPLTSTPKTGKFYFSFLLGTSRSTAILSQMRLLDTRRISRKL